MSKLQTLVDQLGAINAQIKSLDDQASALKRKIIESGQYQIIGDEFTATVVSTHRTQLDMDAVREKLSVQFLTAHTREFDVQSVSLVLNLH